MGNPGWEVTDEANAAMETAAAGLEQTAHEIEMTIKALESIFEENEAGLGAHSNDIRNLIEELKAVGDAANIPVKKLVLKMQKSILVRKQHMEHGKTTQVKIR